jgi:hemoglobin
MRSDEISECPPHLKFAARVALRFDTPTSIGATPDGVRLDFQVHGTVVGPELNGRFPPCAAYLLIDADGIGTINVRAPLFLTDGASAELEATGRYDFGQDGHQRAVALDLPNSALGWCPRFLTGHPRYMWLNRTIFLGVGELRPKQARVDYDLFVVTPETPNGRERAVTYSQRDARSLYERLGRREGIYGLMSTSIDSLHGNEQLNRQNVKLAQVKGRTDPVKFKQSVTDFICKLTGGPCKYTGPSMKDSHAHLDISEADWVVFVDDFVEVMNRYRISRADQGELLELMTRSKSDIVSVK